MTYREGAPSYHSGDYAVPQGRSMFRVANARIQILGLHEQDGVHYATVTYTWCGKHREQVVARDLVEYEPGTLDQIKQQIYAAVQSSRTLLEDRSRYEQ